MHFFQFLNLQYWYCIIYSLFGGECTTVDAGVRGAGDIQVGIGTGGNSLSSTTDVLAVATSSKGFFASIFDFGVVVLQVIGATGLILWSFYSAIAYIASGLLILVIVGSLLGLIFIRYRELSLYDILPPLVTEVS